VSGDRSPIILTAERDTVLTRALEALGSFPLEEPWVLIGGLAVFVRLGSVTRPTSDADTVARSQANLIERLVNDEIATLVSGGEIEVPIRDGIVEIDVMDLNDDPLPGDSERRAFALSRRSALASAVTERVIVTDRSNSVIADVAISLATVPALVALKTVAMVRRPQSKHPEKVGSDIHDLVRLVTTTSARTVATDLVTLDDELARWVADQIERAFGKDLRSTLLRLRTNDRSAAARALSDVDVASTVILADELREQLSGGGPGY
jgi:hypothetical protein